METTIPETAAEERAQQLLSDFHRARNSILKLRADLEELEQLPRSDRAAIGAVLDPVGRLLANRAPGDTSRKLTYGDASELLSLAGIVRGKLGFLLERISVLGDPIPDTDPEPRTAPAREPDEAVWAKKGNDLINYGIGWSPGPDSARHNI